MPPCLRPALALDVREAREFQLSPTLEAANIPLDELERRVYELPPARETVEVYGTGREATTAIAVLNNLGRPATLRPVAHGEIGDDRFVLWRPPAFLVDNVAYLEPGRALCLACGTGREAVWLAARGWNVVAVDRLPDAIERGRRLEQEARLPGRPNIRWVAHDLRRPLTAFPGPFDLACQFHAWYPGTLDRFAEADPCLALFEALVSQVPGDLGLRDWTGIGHAEWTESLVGSRPTIRVLLRQGVSKNNVLRQNAD